MAAKRQRLTTSEVVKNGEKIFHGLRWKYGIVVCPYCGSIHIKEYDGYRYKCNSCKNRFSDKTNTLMHGSKLSVGIWMQAIYEMFTDNFISSNVLSVKLGINQKSAWYLMTKLRYSMSQDTVMLTNGMVAQDEMYVGGCLSNYHYSRKWELLRRGNYVSSDEERYSKEALFSLNSALKQPVFGMTDGDKVVLYALPNKLRKEYLYYLNKKHVSEGSVTVSDESKLYNDWERNTGCSIYTNNHHNNQYVTEEGYTSNAIENRFSWYKRGFGGRVTHCKYHQLYLNEFCFRYNTRNMSTEERFNIVVGSTIGKRISMDDIKATLAYSEFTGLCKRKQPNHLSMESIKKLLSSGVCYRIEQDGKVYTKEDMLRGLF